MEKKMNFLDRNEFNFEPSPKVVEAIRNFDPKTLCFYTRIYDQGKKSVVSVRLSEIYGVPEEGAAGLRRRGHPEERHTLLSDEGRQ